MKIVFFVHSIVSDWNNGHAHFLRGLMKSLIAMGHDVASCERARNWSSQNLLQDHGAGPVLEFTRRFPELKVHIYNGGDSISAEARELTRGADLVIVHEFNEPDIINAVAEARSNRKNFALLFHDTHHRALSMPQSMRSFNLDAYDGVLAFGASLCDVYRRTFDARRTWVFHEAADTSLFYPRDTEKVRDVVWVGNWGDEERSEETRSYLINSARALPHLRFAVYGVRYPRNAVDALREAGIEYRNWAPNFSVPDIFARSHMTLHLPRSYYREQLRGIPTIRPFEALACGIPLITTAWEDRERLFRPGQDYMIVESPDDMIRAISYLSENPEKRASLAANGLETIRAHHTCAHRAEQLMQIYGLL